MDKLEFISINQDSSLESRIIREGRKKLFIENLPSCQTVTDVIAKRNEIKSSSSRLILLKTPKTVLDSFLKKLFNGIDLFKFMRIYSKLHIGEEFLLPVPESIICMFYELHSKDAEKLNSIVEQQNRILTTNLHDGPLNLHDNTIATFTLVEAKGIDLSKLYGGYTYSDGNFNFFIKSSIQFDLTVFYAERKTGT